MYTMPPKNISSPDRRFEARLLPTGGRTWEPSYATLELAGLPFGSRMFGWQGVWSPCSRFFALMEWRHADYSLGPDMHLLVIDVVAGRECVIEQVRNGFVEPMYIAEGMLRYNKMEHGISERVVRDHRLVDEAAWQAVSMRLPEAVGAGGQDRREAGNLPAALDREP